MSQVPNQIKDIYQRYLNIKAQTYMDKYIAHFLFITLSSEATEIPLIYENRTMLTFDVGLLPHLACNKLPIIPISLSYAKVFSHDKY